MWMMKGVYRHLHAAPTSLTIYSGQSPVRPLLWWLLPKRKQNPASTMKAAQIPYRMAVSSKQRVKSTSSWQLVVLTTAVNRQADEPSFHYEYHMVVSNFDLNHVKICIPRTRTQDCRTRWACPEFHSSWSSLSRNHMAWDTQSIGLSKSSSSVSQLHARCDATPLDIAWEYLMTLYQPLNCFGTRSLEITCSHDLKINLWHCVSTSYE